MDGEVQIPDPSRFTFLKALQRSSSRAPLWLLTAFLISAMAAVLALPWLAFLRQSTEHRTQPGSLLVALNETFLFDQREGWSALESSTRNAGALLAFLAALFGCFSAGGWLQVLLERTEGHSLRRYFWGGARYFFRFLRVLGLTLLSLQLLSYVLYGAPWDWLVNGIVLGVKDLHELVDESTARRAVLVQDSFYFAGAVLIFIWGDYTRARMALHDGSSAVWAGLCTWANLLAKPMRMLRPMFLLGVVESLGLLAAWKLGAMFESRLTPPGEWVWLWALLGLGQAVLAWRCIVRGARYAAALEISGEVVRPPRRPDPWKEAVGAPGGPQYPIGGDEYTVSM